MTEQFEGRYEVDDGYVGRNRPQHFTVHAGDLPDEATDEELRTLYDELIDEDFQQRVNPCPQRVEEFIVWARARMAEQGQQG